MQLDLSDASLADVAEIDVGALESATLYLPLPSVGSTNTPSDICGDYIDASWAAEKLAAASDEVSVTDDDSAGYKVRLRLELAGIHSDFREALEDAIVLFQGGEVEEERYADILEQLRDYEDDLESYAPRLPELVDDYFANLVNGAYHELRSEAPEHYEAQIARYPERQFGFHKSALSHRLGAACFASPESWVVPASVDLDSFFAATGQRYRQNDFAAAEILVVNGRSYVCSHELVADFPMNQYFKSRVCAGLALQRIDDGWPSETLARSDATFTRLSIHESVPPHLRHMLAASQPPHAQCMIDSSGTLAVFNDGQFRYFLYGTTPLNRVAIESIYGKLVTTAESLASMVGLSAPLCDWSSLTDEQFEELCYDIIRSQPKFDVGSIRKLGKSRSRDGGRDIEVREFPAQPGARARKWIFQCKLVTNGASLASSKVQDVGDMLDIYDAGGFGVMTSALIDATLYDKLDAVCGKRRIDQLNFSRLELERELVRLPKIREAYFGKQTASR
ncbi:hypothetical protein BSN85_22845 [Bradyrhizobium brasilense]|uniref:hypothetical protein n=1 Tax=Bradyrhizobium brasilense TaxID=1419277 RepID=UPI0009768398|nr:hypothetical protein [Bradyrhizobium brasilense]OMI06310.1 hypothetical protein BSN85_22845 [Bradyrhizobium brasilense]